MGVIPRKLLEKLAWAENHVEPFTTHAVAIGSTVAEATLYEARTVALRAAVTAAEVARDAARSAQIEVETALKAWEVSAAGIVEQVRVKARTTNNLNVFALAAIPAPATPGPRPAPGKPGDLVVELDETGVLTLSWKCANPPGGGTIYQIWRRIGPEGNFEFLGAVGEKKFVDMTLPAGSSSVTYQMQATRSTAVGPWAQFNVNFGVPGVGGGAFSASVTESVPAKIAA